MCGLWGMAGLGIIQKDLAILRSLATVSQLRGTDGAGVYQVQSAYGRNNHEDCYKTENNLSTMLDQLDYDKPFKHIMNNVIPDLFIGHVRASTVGAVTQANAHPFVFQNIVGAHNGTLKDKKYQHAHKTDSEMMFADMNTRGIPPVINELDEKSAYALTMYHRGERALYMTRNSMRTLAIAFNEARNVMYWASELGMLRYILGRSGEKWTDYKVNDGVLLKVNIRDIQCKNKDPLRALSIVYDFLDKEIVNEPEPEPEPVPEVVSEVTKEAEGWTDKEEPFQSELPLEPQVEQAPTQETGKIISFPTATQGKVRSYHAKCACEKHTLKVLDVNFSLRGLSQSFRWDTVLQKHFCNECDPLKQTKVLTA